MNNDVTLVRLNISFIKIPLMLYPFGHKIKTKYQQYTSKGIICLYFLEVQYFKRIIQPYYTFSNEYHPLLYTFLSESNVNKSFQVL